MERRFPEPLWFGGELIEVKRGGAGHGFAILRGPGAKIAVHLPPALLGSGRLPRSGKMVLVRGTLRIWRPAGSFRIEACGPLIVTDSEGARAEARRAAEHQLRAEGALSRPKRPLPRWPREVAVVTSGSGAAIHDVRAVIRRRAPWVTVVLHECIVQGPSAGSSICAALARANASTADVLVLTRGGGQQDHLDAFDEPAVVRAVAGSRLPVIAATGHARDVTLAELAADARAATPSEAAERAVPDVEQLRAVLADFWNRATVALWHTIVAGRTDSARDLETTRRALVRSVALTRERLEHRNPGTCFARVRRLVRLDRAQLDNTTIRVGRATKSRLRDQRACLERRTPERLLIRLGAVVRERREEVRQTLRTVHALSPRAVLARGYVIVCQADSRTVRRARDVKAGDRLTLVFEDGLVAAVVKPQGVRSHQPKEDA